MPSSVVDSDVHVGWPAGERDRALDAGDALPVVGGRYEHSNCLDRERRIDDVAIGWSMVIDEHDVFEAPTVGAIGDTSPPVRSMTRAYGR